MGRTLVCLELGEELWHWCVDRLNKVPGNINTGILLHQPRIYLKDAEEACRIQIEAAARAADNMQIAPHINEQWIKFRCHNPNGKSAIQDKQKQAFVSFAGVVGAIACEYASCIVHCPDPIDYDYWGLTNNFCTCAVLLSVIL